MDLILSESDYHISAREVQIKISYFCFQAQGLRPDALKKFYSGDFVTPLWEAVWYQRTKVFLPLLRAHFSSSSESLLDQECCWKGERKRVRAWADHWAKSVRGVA